MSINWDVLSVASALNWWRTRRKPPEQPTITVRASNTHQTRWRYESALSIIPFGVSPRPLEHPLAYAARVRQTNDRVALQWAKWQFLEGQIDVLRSLFQPPDTPHLLEGRLSRYASELAVHDGAGSEPSTMARRMVRELDPINLVVNQLGDE